MSRVVLHIGAPKTGTSFVQSVLSNNRTLLAERGILWPGTTWSDQVRAVEDLRDATRGKLDGPSRWDSMVGDFQTTDRDLVVVSMEWLCLGGSEMAERAVSSLAQHDVRVVLSLRDLGRAIPAQWQESTQNGFAWTYQRFLKGVSARRPNANRAGAHFWTNQDWARMVKVWGAAAGSDRLWVVTVPPAGSPKEVLWERFCQAADMDPAGFMLEGWPNESLGAASAEIMRRLQDARQSEPRNRRHRGRLKHHLAKQVLARHSKAEPSLILPPEMYGWTLKRSRRLVADVQKAKPHLVGDYDDLLPARPQQTSRTVTDPSAMADGVLLDAALFGLLEITRPQGPAGN